MTKYNPQPDDDTPTQAAFIKRLASIPHTADDADLPGGGPVTMLELGGSLSMLNDAIAVAREIVTRDRL